MKIKASYLIFFIFVGDVYAADFGVVTDIKGVTKAVEAKKAVVVGQSLASGTKYEVVGNGKMVMVDYSTCSEWTIKGPAIVSLSSGAPVVVKGDKKTAVNKTGTLGACFKPSDVKSASSHEVGALVLMGRSGKGPDDEPIPDDNTGPLRVNTSPESVENSILEMGKLAEERKASISELIMLVLHYEIINDRAKIKLYIGYLKEKTPNSEFVKQVEETYKISQ